MKLLHAHYREARRVQPGWQVRCEGTWQTVRLILTGRHLPTNMPIVHLYYEDGSHSYCESFLEVLCRNRAEIRRASKAVA